MKIERITFRAGKFSADIEGIEWKDEEVGKIFASFISQTVDALGKTILEKAIKDSKIPAAILKKGEDAEVKVE